MMRMMRISSVTHAIGTRTVMKSSFLSPCQVIELNSHQGLRSLTTQSGTSTSTTSTIPSVSCDCGHPSGMYKTIPSTHKDVGDKIPHANFFVRVRDETIYDRPFRWKKVHFLFYSLSNSL